MNLAKSLHYVFLFKIIVEFDLDESSKIHVKRVGKNTQILTISK